MILTKAIASYITIVVSLLVVIIFESSAYALNKLGIVDKVVSINLAVVSY